MNTETVTFRVSPLSKAELLELVDRLRMKNQSELFRVLVHETLAILREREAREKESIGADKKSSATRPPSGYERNKS